MHLKLQNFVLTLLFALVLSIGITTQAAQAGNFLELLIRGAQIYQISNISTQDEVALGKQIDREIRSQVTISRNRQAQAMVEAIGQELLPFAGRSDLPFVFQVVEDPNVNAFATMGGFVYIHTGTIAAADNRAQLASVIAHEMGHITGKHALAQMKQAAITQGLATLVGADRDQLVQIGVNLALSLPNSREAEYDADRRGLTNIVESGYAPQAMPQFMKKLVTATNVPTFLSTHPGASERATNLSNLIQQNNWQGKRGLDDSTYQKQWRALANSQTQTSPGTRRQIYRQFNFL